MGLHSKFSLLKYKFQLEQKHFKELAKKLITANHISFYISFASGSEMNSLKYLHARQYALLRRSFLLRHDGKKR